MNTRTLSTLEYPMIKERLMDLVVSYVGRQHIENMVLSTDVRQIETWQVETQEALDIIAGSSSIPIPSLEGIETSMNALNKGIVLGAEQISQFAKFLDGVEHLQHYMDRKRDISPRVSLYAQSLIPLNDLREEIRRCVDRGEVLSSASDELKKIRKQITIMEERVRRKVDALMKKLQAHLQETFYSKREGRYVLPIKRSSKRIVSGIVLDESASGQTVYMEPSELAEVQNSLADLQANEASEMARILSKLTGWIEVHQEEIRRNLEVIGYYDFLFAKAKLAKSMNATRAVGVNSSGRIRIHDGRHPLLGKDAQPLDFSIGEGYVGLIITGPNTGGKTVALKTVGLFTLMMQYGLLIPVGKGSELSVFHQVFADIGDGQSIDQSLSTFSAQIKNVIDILKQAGPKTLVLVDELASGTDPGEGIGLSIAVLERLHSLGATVVATTHFNEIKQFAKTTFGFEVARMEFDAESLRPLYRLRIGEAGESYALVIAEMLGVPREIVDRARALASDNAKGSVEQEINQPKAKKLNESQTGGSYCPEKEQSEHTSDEVQHLKPPKSNPEASFQVGDRVWIHGMKCSGIYVGVSNERGKVIVMVKRQKLTMGVKRIAPYISRNDLYPDAPNYDLDIVLEPKDIRRKRKTMARKYVEGLYIETSPDPEKEV